LRLLLLLSLLTAAACLNFMWGHGTLYVSLSPSLSCLCPTPFAPSSRELFFFCPPLFPCRKNGLLTSSPHFNRSTGPN
jgi:hypothetical protein